MTTKRPTPYTPTLEEFNALRAQLAAALAQRDLLANELRRARETLFSVWANLKLGTPDEMAIFNALQSIDDNALKLLEDEIP